MQPGLQGRGKHFKPKAAAWQKDPYVTQSGVPVSACQMSTNIFQDYLAFRFVTWHYINSYLACGQL